MTEAKKGDKVRVNYTGKLEDGTVVEASSQCDCEGCETGPLEFVIGEEEVLPGLESAVIGMKPGEEKTVHIPSDQAYGPYDEEMVMVVEREHLPADLEPEVGQVLELTDEDGEAFAVEVTEVTDTTITLDANHPLAGRDLIFDIRLEQIG